MSIILQTLSNGSITLSEQDTASNITVTIPAATGTLLTTATAGVPIGGPAFSAYLGTNQSLSHATVTKINIDTEEFDTNSNYASSRFTPTVAGYYQFSAAIAWNVASTGNGIVYLYKNGAPFKLGSSDALDTTGNISVLSALAFANGTTDYFEIYGNQGSFAALDAVAGADLTYFQGCLIRSAT
jgi:hypothetical protein